MEVLLRSLHRRSYNCRRPQIAGYLLSAVLALLFLTSCVLESSSDPLYNTMKAAGKNQEELQRVLAHYANDSLKAEAARFLIEHMHWHETVRCEDGEHMIGLFEETSGLNQHKANVYVDSVIAAAPDSYYDCKGVSRNDAEFITAEILIDNIDDAFATWEQTSWSDSIDFNAFCEYVLPYKSGTEPPEIWRQQYRDHFNSTLTEMDTCLTMRCVSDQLLVEAKKAFRYIRNPGNHNDLAALELINTNAGQCYESAHQHNYQLRAYGIPSVVMYAPQWANHPQGHAWNGLLVAPDSFVTYVPRNANPGPFAIRVRTTKTAKLYVWQYSGHPASFRTNFPSVRGKDLPGAMRFANMVDVTRQIVPASDVSIRLNKNRKKKDPYVFLCLFRRGSLNAVDWSRVTNNTADFDQLANDALFVPAHYRKKKYYPAGDPFIVTFEGDTTSVRLDTSEWIDTRVYRKYPLKPSMFRYTRIFKGMKFQVSATSDFADARDIHEIDRWPSPVIENYERERDRWEWIDYRDSVVFDTPVEARYLRLFAAPDQQCIVGDITCFDEQGNVIEASAYGSAEGADAVLDGLYGETYHDEEKNGWVALDFGRDVKVSKIWYLPSHDSNSIQVGENYELFYWADGWVSLGKQRAESKYLDYRAPKNALFWLTNLDTGKEERVFTLDPSDRKQVWW